MASNSKLNTGFHNDVINFVATYSLSWILPMGSKSELNGSSNEMVYSRNSNIIDNKPLTSQCGNAVDLSVDEQKKLEEGLVRYADEPYVMKFMKIASTLRDKTVRDVALRGRWTTLKVYRAIEQVHADKKRVSSRLELVQPNIAWLNSKIDRLCSDVTRMSLRANLLSSSLRDLEAREAELLATLGF